MLNLKVLNYFLSHPKEIISLGYQAMVRKRNFIDYEKLASEKYSKSQLPTIDLLDLIPGFNGVLDCYSFLSGTSTIVDILLLKALAQRYDQCCYLEIGSLRGESIAAVADVAYECNSLTLSPEEMKDFGFLETTIKSHGIFSKNKPNIKSYLHNSLTFDFASLNKKFDLIFVDGDHAYDNVVQDTRNVFKLLKNDKSVIVWHDYGFDPENVRHEVLAAILAGVPEQYHQHLYHVSNSMCAVFIKGEFPATISKEALFPNKSFRVEVEARKL
jgi:predicted O-methyltransferase YrrM